MIVWLILIRYEVLSLAAKAKKAAFWSLLDKVFSQGGYLLVIVYLANLLEPRDFGIVGMLAVFLILSDVIVSGGFSQALIQRSHKATDDDFSTVFLINLVISILIYIFLYISAPLIADFYHVSVLVDVSRVAFISIIINSIAIVPRSKLIIEVDFRSQALVNVVSMIVSSSVAIWLARMGYGYWSLVYMALVKAVISTITLVILCSWKPSISFSIDSFKGLFGFGSKLLVANIISTSINNLFILMIGRFFNPMQVGYFTQARTYPYLLSDNIGAVIQGVSFPIMTSIQDDKEKLLSIYERVLGMTMFISLPFLVGFAAISFEFVSVFLGDKWLPAVQAMIFFSVARSLTPISIFNMNILNATGRSDLFLRIDLLKLPLTVGALFVSLPYGINAVAFSLIVTTVIAFFINSYYPGKLYGFGAKKQIQKLAPLVFSCILMWLAISLVQFNNLILTLILKVVVGAIVYMSVCLVLKVPYIDDVKSLWRRN